MKMRASMDSTTDCLVADTPLMLTLEGTAAEFLRLFEEIGLHTVSEVARKILYERNLDA